MKYKLGLKSHECTNGKILHIDNQIKNYTNKALCAILDWTQI